MKTINIRDKHLHYLKLYLSVTDLKVAPSVHKQSALQCLRLLQAGARIEQEVETQGELIFHCQVPAGAAAQQAAERGTV